MNVGQFGVPEESPNDSRAFLESFQGVHRDGLEFVSGQRHGPSDPVVLDVFVDLFIRVQLGRIGGRKNSFQSSLRARDVLRDNFRFVDG